MTDALLAHLRSPRALIWAGVLCALAVALAFVPLFDALGFEFAFAMGIPASLAAADLAAAFVRRARALPPPRAGDAARPGRIVARLYGASVATGLALLVVPLVVISLNALRVRQCDWLGGLVFFAGLPVLAVPFGAAAGQTAALVLPARPRLATTLAWLLVIGSLVVGVARFYAAPPIFGYDPFAGYFPGTLYDEEVALGGAFFWSRIYQAAFALAALAACAATLDVDSLGVRPGRRRDRRPAGRRLGPIAVAAAAGVAAGVLWLKSAELGFTASASDIARALGGRRETAHFVIYYPRGPSFDPFMDAIAAEHELRYAQVKRAFGVEPAGKITSFYFATAADKARWMGAANTYIAKPWRREIYVQHEDFPHDTLRHEIAHVFAGAFGDPLFRVSVAWWGWPPARFNVGLIEGAAVAADWPGSPRMTPHQSARAMKELGLLPPLRRLLAPGFLSFSPAASYTTSGSFAYFLLTRHGAEKFRAIYRAGGGAGDFARVYGLPLGELEREWHAEIAAAPLAPEDLDIARERFRRRGIFHRPCPHAVAKRATRAGELLAAGRADEAVAKLRRVCSDDPEPSHRLLLAAALDRARRGDEAAAIYHGLADDAERHSPPLRATALLYAADLHARRGELGAARAAVESALALGVDEGTRRNLLIRRLAYDPAGPPGAAELTAYLVSRNADGTDVDPVVQLARANAVVAALPDRGLGHYLVGRLLSQHGGHAEAAAELALAQRLGLPDPLVARENDRLLARSAFLAGDLGGARAAAARLADPAQPLAVQLEGRDWEERCRFAETGRL